jgi:hypothetical protein
MNEGSYSIGGMPITVACVNARGEVLPPGAFFNPREGHYMVIEFGGEQFISVPLRETLRQRFWQRLKWQVKHIVGLN